MLFAILLAAAPDAQAQSTGSSSSTYSTPTFVPTLANRTYFAVDVYHDVDAIMLRAMRDDWNRPISDLITVRGYTAYESWAGGLDNFTTRPAGQIYDGTVHVSTFQDLTLVGLSAEMALPSWGSRQIGLIYTDEVVAGTDYDEHTVFFGPGGANLALDGFVLELTGDDFADWDDQMTAIKDDYPNEWESFSYALEQLEYKGLPPAVGANQFANGANGLFAFEVRQDPLGPVVGWLLMERRAVQGKMKYVNHWALTDDYVMIGDDPDGNGPEPVADLAIVTPMAGYPSLAAWLTAMNAKVPLPTTYARVPGHTFEPLGGGFAAP